MAIQYVVTEEEMMSLIESLELHALRKNNIMRADYSTPPTHEEMHRSFHFVAVRWAQSIGFRGLRG